MRRYKLAVHILVILSVFNCVPVHAAPVPVRGVREVGQDPRPGYQGLTQASPGPGSPSVSDSASGVHQKTTRPIQPPSSASGEMQRPPYASGGTELPWYSPGEIRRPPYAKGGTEMPWYSSGEMRKPPYAKGGTELPWYSKPATSVRTKPAGEWVPTTEPASSSSGRITPASSSGKVRPPSVPPPSEQIPPASSSKVHPLSGQEGHLSQTPTEQSKPQSKSFWSNLASKSKSLFSLSKLIGYPKL